MNQANHMQHMNICGGGRAGTSKVGTSNCCHLLPRTVMLVLAVLQTLVEDNYIPVVASVASDGNGQALNVNADTAAGEVSTTETLPNL